jgi:hypothetical protein
MKTPHQRKPLRGVAYPQEKMIIYNVRQFCGEEKNNKGLVF